MESNIELHDIQHHGTTRPSNIKLDINEDISAPDCFVCLEECSSDVVDLPCCKQKLHKNCLLQCLLYQFTQQNRNTQQNGVNCPLCRRNLKMSSIFTVDEVLHYIVEKKKHIDCVKSVEFLLQNEYNKNLRLIQLGDGVNKWQQIPRFERYKTYACSLCGGFFALFVFFMVIIIVFNNQQKENK